MAHEVKWPLRLLGEGEEDVHIGIDGKRLLCGPRFRLSIADEIGGEHAPIGFEGLDQRQPFLVRSARALADDDDRTFALVEIGDFDASDGELLQVIITPAPGSPLYVDSTLSREGRGELAGSGGHGL